MDRIHNLVPVLSEDYLKGESGLRRPEIRYPAHASKGTAGSTPEAGNHYFLLYSTREGAAFRTVGWVPHSEACNEY